MIRATEANNSSLINAELTYNPQSPKTNANTFISFCMEWFEFFALSENSSHAPINPNIINTESPSYKEVILVEVCSATDVVNGSVELKNGLTAFRYLNDGTPNPDERTAIPDATNMPNTIIEFRILIAGLLNLWTIKVTTKKIVEPKIRRPPYPTIKSIPGLSNNNTVESTEAENIGIAQKRNWLSFLKNGNEIKNADKGNVRNWIPPQDAKPSVKNRPPKINFIIVIFPLLFFIAERRR